ncbi:MAG TPA: hypothetical protein VH044_02865 [Polyangiaceae bacterium]|jgi:hypothetical protein|nr:hypothetical protein [Polyangiaceae bacterium]
MKSDAGPGAADGARFLPGLRKLGVDVHMLSMPSGQVAGRFHEFGFSNWL